MQTNECSGHCAHCPHKNQHHPVASLVFRLRRYDHVMDTFATLHWLRLPQCVDFKLVAMAFLVLHGLAPPYLNQLAPVVDLPSRCRLRSASSHQLLVPPFRLTTVGRRTFPVAASLLWNSLPSDIQASSSSVKVSKHFFFASLFMTLSSDHTTPSWSMQR